MRLFNHCSTRNKYRKWFNSQILQPKLLRKSLDHLCTKLKISLCCILRDLIFLFITLSSETTLSWFVKPFVFPRSADSVSVVSKMSVSEIYVKPTMFSVTSSFFCWPYGSMFLSTSQLILRYASSTIVANGSPEEQFWFTTSITPGSESLLSYVGEFSL